MAADLAAVDAVLVEVERMEALRPRTLANYRCELRAAAALLTMPLDRLSAAELDRYLTRGRVAPGTVL